MRRADVIRELTAIRDRCDRVISALQQPAQSAGEPDRKAPRPFRGHPLEAKQGGRCCVCGQSYGVGCDVVFNGDCRKYAHLGCGAPILRGAK